MTQKFKRWKRKSDKEIEGLKKYAAAYEEANHGSRIGISYNSFSLTQSALIRALLKFLEKR